MHRRLIAIALILATFLQGPAVVYAATLGSSIADSITHTCGGQTLANGSDCEACCSHGSMPSCTAQCPAPVGAAVPLMLPAWQRIALRGEVVPDDGAAPFAKHHPTHPLRPPIV